MASPAVSPTPVPPSTPLPVLHSAARSDVCWAALGGRAADRACAMAGVQDSEGRTPVLPWVVALLGLTSLGLAVWHALTLWLQKLPPEQQATVLASQRRATAIALLAGGAAMVVIAAILATVSQTGSTAGIGPLYANFGESVGLFLFALVALGAGRVLFNPPRDPFASVDLTPVRNLFPLIRGAVWGRHRRHRHLYIPGVR